jgi:hypothetical protein
LDVLLVTHHDDPSIKVSVDACWKKHTALKNIKELHTKGFFVWVLGELRVEVGILIFGMIEGLVIYWSVCSGKGFWEKKVERNG